MKKYGIGLLLLLGMVATMLDGSCACPSSCDCENVGKSYLSVRPHFQSVSPEMVSGFRSMRTHARKDGAHGAFQAVLFGSKSTSSTSLARYFFPFCKTKLIVDERIFSDEPSNSERQDLLASHFNIFTRNANFRSQISIDPQQTVVGIGFHHRHSFFRHEGKGRGFWGSISFPFERVKNNLNFTEVIIRDGGGADEADDVTVNANMTEAFKQAEWTSGKIDCCNMVKVGIADIELKVGYEWLEHDPCHLESYIGIVVPTGNKPTARYLFEPIVGNGHHVGLMTGSSFGARIWKNEEKDQALRLEYSIHSQYLFQNTQCRSLDLNCKPWSRYIELYADLEEARAAFALHANGSTVLATTLSTPGINILTQSVKVTPGFSFNMTTALVFVSGDGMQGELGYNLYARKSECLELASPWKEGPAIKHQLGRGLTNPIRDITGNPRLEGTSTNPGIAVHLESYNNNIIKESDLDLVSAASPAFISHNFYGSAGYNWGEMEYPAFMLVGGSYEFGSTDNNAVVDRWTLWVKGGVSF